MSRLISLEKPRTPRAGRTLVRRWWDAIVSIDFSPIERWLDSNYAPYRLDVTVEQTTDSYFVIAPLHGFDTPDVHVDLCRGHVIILLAHEDVTSDDREFYAEVPIPADARPDRALVNTTADSLTVTLGRKVNVFRRAGLALARVSQWAELLFSRE